MRIKNWLLDIRDYAYYLENKQNGNLLGKVRYGDKLLVLFGLYFMIVAILVLSTIRIFYYLPFIKTIQNSSFKVRALVAIASIYLPFKVTHYLLEKYFKNIPFPDEHTPPEVIRKKKRVFWFSILAAIIIIIIEACVFSFMGRFG